MNKVSYKFMEKLKVKSDFAQLPGAGAAGEFGPEAGDDYKNIDRKRASFRCTDPAWGDLRRKSGDTRHRHIPRQYGHHR